MNDNRPEAQTEFVSDWAAGIVAVLKDGDPVGTGFVVQADPPLLVTCAHVLAGAGWPHEAWEQPVNVRFRDGIKPRNRAAMVLADGYDYFADIAVLRLTGSLPAGARPLPLAASIGSEGASVLFFGHPQEGTAAQERWGWGTVLGLLKEGGQARLQIRSEDVTGGFSGGPVWHVAWQRVVGMVLAGAKANENVRFAAPIQVLPQVYAALAPAVQSALHAQRGAASEGIIHVVDAAITVPEWGRAAEVRFSVTNAAKTTMKLAKLKLIVSERLEIDDVRLQLPGAPVAEFELEADIRQQDEVDLLQGLSVQFITPAGGSEAMKLRIECADGFRYRCTLEGSYMDIRTGEPHPLQPAEFTIDYPISLLETLKRRRAMK